MEDIEISEALVRSLLREQHPDLARLELREVSGGWDNQVWRLGDKLAVRMPRTERAPSLLRIEQRWLPALAPKLPLPVPEPVRVGESSARFPKTWTVVRWVDGEPADRAPISSPRAPDTLAEFLTALHREAPGQAPTNPGRGVPLKALREAFDAGEDYVFRFKVSDAERQGRPGAFPVSAASEVAANARLVWERAVAAPAWADAPVWIHGDFHPANVIVSGGTLSGVIDFGEMCAGDPAADLAAAWLLLPAAMVQRFFQAYENADNATILRAQGWAVLRALGLMGIGKKWEQGLPGGKQTWGPAGWAALQRILGQPPPSSTQVQQRPRTAAH